MPLLPRPEIQGMAICPHGGIDYAELEMLGVAPEEVTDFSANLNPFGPPEEIMKAFNGSRGELNQIVSHYPDSQATQLRHCLARKSGVRVDNILVGSGCTGWADNAFGSCPPYRTAA